MKIKILWIGKSKNKQYVQILEEYIKRLKRYAKCDIIELKDVPSSSSVKVIKKKEAEVISSKIENSDYVVLLDERGRHMSSVEFAEWLQHKRNISLNTVLFIVAGANGADKILKDRADYTLAMSKMTLTHDMIRILLVEQTYRAFTILKGEKYHNE